MIGKGQYFKHYKITSHKHISLCGLGGFKEYTRLDVCDNTNICANKNSKSLKKHNIS